MKIRSRRAADEVLRRESPGRTDETGAGEAMKILMIAPQPFYRERGTPIAVKLLLETLSEAGHEVDLLTYHEGEDLEIPGLRIIRIPPPPLIRNVPIGFSWKKVFCDLYVAAVLARLLRRNGYHVIHAVEESIFPAAAINCLYRKKLVYDMDSLMSDQLIERWGFLRPARRVLYSIERSAIRRADVILPVCENLAARIRGFFPPQRICVLEDVPLPSGPAGQVVENLRRAFGIRGLLALYVGNLEAYQGIDLLLKGFASLPAGHNLDLVIVGGSEKDIARYRQMAKALGLAGRTHFAGSRPVECLHEYLRQADILLSPRIKGENTPMKIYSYLASGRPILATDIGTHTQALDGSCAVLVPPEPGQISLGLERLESDPALRKRLGEAGELLARERYSRAAFRKKVLGVYASLS